MSVPASEYQCVRLEMYGSSQYALFVSGPDNLPTNLQSRYVYLNDPENVDSCVLAAETDEEFRNRCLNARFVFAWVPPWLARNAQLEPHKEPARPCV